METFKVLKKIIIYKKVLLKLCGGVGFCCNHGQAVTTGWEFMFSFPFTSPHFIFYFKEMKND